MTNFDNNKDKICLLLKDDVGRSCVRSYIRLNIRSHDHNSCDHGVTNFYNPFIFRKIHNFI